MDELHKNLNSQIKIFYEIISRNNKFGSFRVGDFKFFYKVLNINDYNREFKGYNIIKKYYDVEKLLINLSNDKTGILIYVYDEEIGDDKGLLVDYYASNEKLDKQFFHIIDIYKNVFKATLKYTITNSCDIFYKNRVDSRLKKYYDDNFLEKYSKNEKILFNGKNIQLNLKLIKKELEEYYSENNRKYWSIISQCDPTDLNITMKGKMIDYLAGGENPLMAEFAMFIWQNVSIGNYLAIKYNSKYFCNHPKIKSKIDTIEYNHVNKTLFHYIRNIRLESIIYYIDELLIPLMAEIDYKDWYNDLKNFIGIKTVTIFDLNIMEEKDKYLSLCYLHLFYSNNFKSLEELRAFLINFYQKISISNSV